MTNRRSILKLLLGLPTVPMVISDALQTPPKRDMGAIIDEEAQRLEALYEKVQGPMSYTDCSEFLWGAELEARWREEDDEVSA